MAGEEAAAGTSDDDYMGDLSLFLPPEHPSPSTSKKVSRPKTENQPVPKSKRPKSVPWQEQRKLERERKQREEDERTIAGTGAAIPDSNVGFKMLKMMGYNPGSALGKDGKGLAEPVGLEIRRSRAGIGRESEADERARKEREAAERDRRSAEELAEEFGARQKMEWKSKRVVWDYGKAEAALAQLENREIVEVEKEEDEKEKEEEEEEEKITEEDLQAMLIKLREEHRYCLYCGCQYESMESLETNCPGLNEEDH